MIVKISFKNSHEPMLFGDSYKKWEIQASEFFLQNKELFKEIVTIEKSKSKWVGWGGLKWCPEKSIQKQLNREGCQAGDPDNVNPRQYSDMLFSKDDKLISKLEYYLR